MAAPAFDSVAHTHIILVHGNVDGSVLLLQKLCQLADGVFGGAWNKNIGTDLCVDLQHLPQQRKKSGNIFFLCLTDSHFTFPQIFLRAARFPAAAPNSIVKYLYKF